MSMLLIFSIPVLIRHLWQLKSADFLHRCLKHGVLLHQDMRIFTQNESHHFRKYTTIACWYQVCQSYDFAKVLVLLVSGLAPSSQTVGSSLRTPGRQSWIFLLLYPKRTWEYPSYSVKHFRKIFSVESFNNKLIDANLLVLFLYFFS